MQSNIELPLMLCREMSQSDTETDNLSIRLDRVALQKRFI